MYALIGLQIIFNSKEIEIGLIRTETTLLKSSLCNLSNRCISPKSIVT